MRCPPIQEATYQWLKCRIGRCHLEQRLGIERDYEARVFGQGLNFFHIENWYSVHRLIRNSLRVMLLHGRGRRNARQISLRENAVTLAGLPAAFDGYRILHISDLHLDMAGDIPAALIEAVAPLEYDACVLTGDFRANTFGPYDATLAALEQVKAHLTGPVFGVLGNHDTIQMVPCMEQLGIQMLLNESVALEHRDATVFLAGIDDPHYYRADNLEKASAAIPDDATSILLAHSPEIFRHAAYAGFDLMLSGHTHAGQICLPGGRPLMCNARCPRFVCAGAWQFEQLQGYTSAGSGVSVVDVRFNCPPEVTLHVLRAA
jgi:predicted MPP superfamily phosphohydrolase